MPTVLIPSMMREAAGGCERVEVEGSSLKEALTDLVRRFPALEGRIFDDGGDLQLHLGFFIDGVEAKASRGAYAELRPDSEVIIVPALGGGST